MEYILENPTDFKTKSREVWTKIRSGTPFEQLRKDDTDYSENFYGSGDSEGINFVKLIRFIKDSEQDHTLIFNWNDFEIPATVQQNRVRDGEGGAVDWFKIIKNNIPFTYESDKKEKIVTGVSGILNKKIDYLEDEWGYRLKIDAKEKIIQASLRYYYENTKQFRSDASDTPKQNDYRIKDKYVAISLTSENLDDFCHLIREIEGETIFKKMQREIGVAYSNQILETTKPKELDFLYENAPDFVFESILDEDLFEHLKILLKWDHKKWFIDSSNAMMKILLGFKNLKKLYEMLEQDPNYILQLYQEMDKSNPQMFGEMMSFLGILFCNKDKDKRTIVIPVGENYSLDSDLFFDKSSETINLNVYEKIQSKNNNNPMSNYVGGLAPAIPTGTIIELKSLASYSKLHPLDMVTIVSDDGTTQAVAAIYVKYLSDAAEREDIQNTVYVIIAIVSILVSAGALASGAGIFWSTVAVTDIALATVDLALRVDEIKKELSKYEAGKWFVENWDAIYGVAGVAMLSTITASITARGILTNGPLLLAKLTYQKGQLKNFVRSAIANAILNIEISNFTKNTFKYIPWEEIRTVKGIDNFGISTSIAKKMHKANVIMAISEDAQTMVLIYKGEAIAVGDGKSIKKTLKSIYTYARKEKDVVAHLDELSDFQSIKILEEDGYAVVRGVDNSVISRAWLSGEGEFNMFIRTKGTEFEKKGRLIFKKLFQFINSEYDEVHSIRGTWRDSEGVADNLKTFNKFILERKTVDEAAFGTFTGKMANELDFTRVKIIELTSLKKPDGTYSSVDIIFYK